MGDERATFAWTSDESLQGRDVWPMMLSGGLQKTSPGSHTGMFEQLDDFVSSGLFGVLWDLWRLPERTRAYNEYRDERLGVAGEGLAGLEAAWEGAPVSPSTQVRIREDATFGPGSTPAAFRTRERERLQGIIDRGEEIPGHLLRYVERVPLPGGRRQRRSGDIVGKEPLPAEGYIPAVGRVAREGLAEAETFYDPASVSGRFESFAGPLREGYAGLEAEGRAGAAGLVSGQQTRERKLLKMQVGMGRQERKDIEREYEIALGNEQVRLGQAGLMGTGVASSASYANLRERTDALGRFEERMRGERLDLSERLSGETLQARAGALEFGLGLGRERLGVEGELGAAGLVYGDTAWQNIQGARGLYGMMPAEAGLTADEAWWRRQGDIQPLPPYMS